MITYSVTECVCGDRFHMRIKQVPSAANPALDTHIALDFAEQRAWTLAHREHAGPQGIRWVDVRSGPV